MKQYTSKIYLYLLFVKVWLLIHIKNMSQKGKFVQYVTKIYTTKKNYMEYLIFNNTENIEFSYIK